MTSRERVLTTFSHRPPDRVPAWCGASPEFRELARRHLGLPHDESLSLYLGDDFRRVYAKYVGPHLRAPAEIKEYPWPNPDWMDVSHIRSEALEWKGQFAALGGKLMIRNRIL